MKGFFFFSFPLCNGLLTISKKWLFGGDKLLVGAPGGAKAGSESLMTVPLSSQNIYFFPESLFFEVLPRKQLSTKAKLSPFHDAQGLLQQEEAASATAQFGKAVCSPKRCSTGRPRCLKISECRRWDPVPFRLGFSPASSSSGVKILIFKTWLDGA